MSHKKDQTKDQPTADLQTIDLPTTDEPKADEPKADEPKAEPTKIDQIRAALNTADLTDETLLKMISEIIKDRKPSQTTGKPSLRSFLKDQITAGIYTQKEILDAAALEFPHLLRATISTILSDSKNAKYNKFDSLVIVTDGIYAFSK